MDGLEENEPNTITVKVGRNMNKADVVEEILRQIAVIERQA